MACQPESLPRHIEIVGLPGVGKSFLMAELGKCAPEIAARILPNSPATWREKIYDLPHFLSHRKWHQQARLQPHAQQIGTRLKRLARRRPFINRHRHRLLLDCGLAQPLLEIFMFWSVGRQDIDWHAHFITCLMPHHYLILTDRIESIVERESNRSPRLFPYAGQMLYDHYEAAANLLCDLQNAMPWHGILSLEDLPDQHARLDALQKTLTPILETWQRPTQ